MKRIVTLFIAIAFMASMVSVFAAVGNNDVDSAAEKIAEAGIGRYDKFEGCNIRSLFVR